MWFLKKRPEKAMVVVVPSYNNAQWYKHNLDSIFNQKYSNYRVIYIDDASTDNTAQLVTKYIQENNVADKITFIQNEQNKGATANRYHGSHLCEDYEIVLILDGDDWFAHTNVLNVINKAYADDKTWITYGQYQRYPSGLTGHCKKLSASFDYRASSCYYTSALRTYYAWLFKRIHKEDLMEDNKFFRVAGDVAEMLPMLEMARGHVKFIKRVLYIYNNETPLNDFKKSLKTQIDTCARIRKKAPYSAIVQHQEVPHQ